MPNAKAATRTRLSWILWALLQALGQKARFLGVLICLWEGSWPQGGISGPICHWRLISSQSMWTLVGPGENTPEGAALREVAVVITRAARWVMLRGEECPDSGEPTPPLPSLVSSSTEATQAD